MNKKYISNSVEETWEIASEIVSELTSGDVVALIGNLGTGKTTFTKGFANSMGVTESVGSPTFKLISEYEGRKFWLFHIDCYRLDNSQQFINIGGGEYLESDKGITLIEWADIIEDILPVNSIKLNFKRLTDDLNGREITINNKI